MNYYRLVDISPGGRSHISGIIRTEYKQGLKSSIVVFPNPVHDHCLVRITMKAAGIYTILFRSAEGRTVKTIRSCMHAGLNELNVEMKDLSAGIYYVSMEGASSVSITIFKD